MICFLMRDFQVFQSEWSDIMEELLVYAILLYEGLVTENEYNKRLDELFLTTPENDDLLYLEWETDISKAIIYVRTHIDYKNLNLEQFGRILMSKLKVVYKNCLDIKYFASQMYRLWESFPEYSEYRTVLDSMLCR